jgi:hypothetical protein
MSPDHRGEPLGTRSPLEYLKEQQLDKLDELSKEVLNEDDDDVSPSPRLQYKTENQVTLHN